MNYNKYFKPVEISKDDIKTVIEVSEYITTIAKSEIVFNEPILKRKSENVIFPNTISIIQGKAGTHKSRLAQIICAAFIQKTKEEISLDKSDTNLLGFHSNCDAQILYFDTERNAKDQFANAYQEIKLLANYKINDNLDKVIPYSLNQSHRIKRLNLISEIIAQNVDNSKKLIVIIDIVTDLLSDFNNVEETMELIDKINETINIYSVSFIIIIHENPYDGFDKARGHLGTELMNKATTHLSIKEDKMKGEIKYYKINYLKCRNSKKYPSYYVKYDESIKTLVEINDEELEVLRNSRNTKADISDIIDFIPEFFEDGMSQKVIIEKILLEFKCSERTAKERLKNIEENKIEITNAKGLHCNLIRSKNKPVEYQLKLI